MTEVYIITSGEYSSYSIDAVYTDKAVAMRLKELGFRVETWETDIKINKLHAGFFPFNAWSWLDNDEIYISPLLPDIPDMRNDAVIGEMTDWAATDELRRKINLERHRIEPIMRLKFETWLWARDKEHAIKIASERKAMLLNEYRLTGSREMKF